MDLKSRLFSIICGFSIGLIICSLLMKNYEYHGIDSNIVKKHIYHSNNRCFKLLPSPYMCIKEHN
jgi:hypothetical protein